MSERWPRWRRAEQALHQPDKTGAFSALWRQWTYGTVDDLSSKRLKNNTVFSPRFFFSPVSVGEPWRLLCHCLPSIGVSLLWFLINALIQGIFRGTSCIHMLCWSVPWRAAQSKPHVLAKTNHTREQSHCPWRHRNGPSAEESLLSLDKSILLTASLDGSLIN